VSNPDVLNASAPTIACLFAGDSQAAIRVRAVLPDELLLVESSHGTASAALAAMAQEHPGRDVLLIHADAELTLHIWQRLQLARDTYLDAQVWTPLCARVNALDPRPRAATLSSEAVDRWCWLLADRSYPQSDHCSPLLSLWRAATLQLCLDRGGRLDMKSAAITCIRLCDSVFVAANGADLKLDSGVPHPAAAVLRERIQAVHAQTLPNAIGLDGRPVVLHVLHGWGGGAERFATDLIEADQTHRHLVLMALGNPQRRVHGEVIVLRATPGGANLRQWPMAAAAVGTRMESAEYRALLDSIIGDFAVAGVVVSSLIGHSLDALKSGLPTAVVCHDYYPAWPILHADFGDASVDFSSAAIPQALQLAAANFEFSEPRAAYWQALRMAYIETLTRSDALLIAPSRSVRDNLCRIVPALKQRRWQQIGHGLAEWLQPLPTIAPDPKRAALRIVVPGRIKGGKGETLLAELLPRLPTDVELILLGCGAAGMRFFGHPQVHVQLDYERQQLPDLLARLMPDAALLPASVAETFSYTLSELRALGVPVIATALGSFVERIADGRNGLLVSPNAESVAKLLQALSDDSGPLTLLRQRWPNDSLQSMCQAYADVLGLAPASLGARWSTDTLTTLQRQTFEIALTVEKRQRTTLAKQLVSQQSELERRAEWANSEHRQAERRLEWAQSLQAQVASTSSLLLDTQALLEATDSELRERGQHAIVLAEQLDTLQQQSKAELDAAASQLIESQSLIESLVEHRDHFQAARDEMLASISWRITKPMRYARRLIRHFFGGIATRLRFRISRATATRKRVASSLRVRGISGTWRRLRQEVAPPPSAVVYDIPTMPTVSNDIPDVDDIVLVRPAAPRVSIIVPVHNHLAHTITCLRALSQQRQKTTFEVIVVDDCSSDASADLLPKMRGLHYLRNRENLGFIGACNAGAAVARGEYLVFLNNDTAVQAGWLDALIDTFSLRPDAGLVGAKLVYPDGRLQEAGGIVFNDGSGWNYGRFDDPADPRYNFVREVDYCSGAAIVLPAELFHSLGGFDSHYAPAYYEDTDLAMKVRAAGLSVLYQPASVVIHFEGISSGTDTASGIKAFQLVNQQKFLARWQNTLAAHAAPPPHTPIEISRQHRARRHVLVIDATVPQPDQDSGSLRLVNLLRLLVDEGCAVTFFADNRAYIADYCEVLQQLGIEVLWHPWLGDPVGWFAEHGKRFHSVLVSRHYIACSYIDLVRRHAPKARFIFDTVDLHYLREQRAAELAGRSDLAKTAEQTRKLELDVIQRSDVSLVVSPVEAALLAIDAPAARVEILSNVHEVLGCRKGFAERSDLMFIGGYQHPPNVDAAVWFVGEVWPLIRAAAPELKFHLIGSKANEQVKALGAEKGVVFHGHVENIEPFLDGCRLAVAPLRYGAGVKGKVNMSMSYGQPVVATPAAVEGMHLRADEDVLVASTPREFADAVLRLYADEALWQTLSANGLHNVREHFGFDAARAVIRRLLE